MCEVNLVKVQCVTVKLLTIFHNKKFVKAKILGDTTMCYCEGIVYFISNVFRVSHFADGPFRTCFSDASALRSMYFVQSGGKLVLRKTHL